MLDRVMSPLQKGFFTAGRAFQSSHLCSQEGKRQRKLCDYRPVRIGSGTIVQLKRERDGTVPKTAQPMLDHLLVQAVFIIHDITHPPRLPCLRGIELKGGD